LGGPKLVVIRKEKKAWKHGKRSDTLSKFKSRAQPEKRGREIRVKEEGISTENSTGNSSQLWGLGV